MQGPFMTVSGVQPHPLSILVSQWHNGDAGRIMAGHMQRQARHSVFAGARAVWPDIQLC